jgi:isoquinoline 1-oxidoreductase subunit alpha
MSRPTCPLLWVLRDVLDLKGTKFGCGIAQCGACTVHVDGAPIRSCILPAGAARAPTSRPSRGSRPTASHPLQKAWEELDVPQCGYCQAGQLMSGGRAARPDAQPTDADIDAR